MGKSLTISNEAIRRFGEENFTKQAAFAAFLNVSPGTLSRWEKGEAVPPGTVLLVLALLLCGRGYVTATDKAPSWCERRVNGLKRRGKATPGMHVRCMRRGTVRVFEAVLLPDALVEAANLVEMISRISRKFVSRCGVKATSTERRDPSALQIEAQTTVDLLESLRPVLANLLSEASKFTADLPPPRLTKQQWKEAQSWSDLK